MADLLRGHHRPPPTPPDPSGIESPAGSRRKRPVKRAVKRAVGQGGGGAGGAGGGAGEPIATCGVNVPSGVP